MKGETCFYSVSTKKVHYSVFLHTDNPDGKLVTVKQKFAFEYLINPDLKPFDVTFVDNKAFINVEKYHGLLFSLKAPADKSFMVVFSTDPFLRNLHLANSFEEFP